MPDPMRSLAFASKFFLVILGFSGACLSWLGLPSATAGCLGSCSGLRVGEEERGRPLVLGALRL